ncbi:CcoQ/FixQ family Cbb3-type cytochrome c oxidase assembly chaperone [Eisenibacter elegans]|jgi:cytochrome c oxidase cbb3-type subunit 3|uniref:CcoQ/FixQ family Cbb3-type cytochrome c oxidase assembly chaperone n=1 Tax=Eisenibacter elegans TaxID=997 RepID=UPI001378742A|nr:CcoQ/FixQ family Cbb3-type cytochrome c oxidase assembly chaperone [Eisenibacter elegans]
MKFRHYLERIQDVEIFPLLGLLLFFGFFVAMLAWLWLMKKERFEEWSELPLEKHHEGLPYTPSPQNNASN